MTEKRFTEIVSTGIVTDNATGKKYNCDMRIDDELLKLLNELSDENEQLKSLNQYLIELLKQNGATVEIEKVIKND